MRHTPGDRPPVRQAINVRADVAGTFDAFVRTIGSWWPAEPFSAGKHRVRDITIEPAEGGQVYEYWDDGTTIGWGKVLSWEPPHRFVMSWTETPVPTEVEISFRALGPALTRVTVEHRGWEAMTEQELGRDCALPGGYLSGGYAIGWAQIFAAFGNDINRENHAYRDRDTPSGT